MKRTALLLAAVLFAGCGTLTPAPRWSRLPGEGYWPGRVTSRLVIVGHTNWGAAWENGPSCFVRVVRVRSESDPRRAWLLPRTYGIDCGSGSIYEGALVWVPRHAGEVLPR